MTTDELKALLDKARETFCLASPGSDAEFEAYLCGFDSAAKIATSHYDALRERETRLVEALTFARNRLEMMCDDAWHGDARDFKRSLQGVFAEWDAALAAWEQKATNPRLRPRYPAED